MDRATIRVHPLTPFQPRTTDPRGFIVPTHTFRSELIPHAPFPQGTSCGHNVYRKYEPDAQSKDQTSAGDVYSEIRRGISYPQVDWHRAGNIRYTRGIPIFYRSVYRYQILNSSVSRFYPKSLCAFSSGFRNRSGLPVLRKISAWHCCKICPMELGSAISAP